MAINTAADQKGAEQMAQPDPDPEPNYDRAAAVTSAADGVSLTEDMPTVCDGSPSLMKDIGHNEGIPVDAASTPTRTPKKPQLAQECPAPVYMAKTCQDTIEPNGRYVLSLYYDGIGCLAHAYMVHVSRTGSIPCDIQSTLL